MSAHTYRPGEVTYPNMERQDLTQSQLGAFKFTPTDAIRQEFQQLASAHIRRQYEATAATAAAIEVARATENAAQDNLADVRLRFGPAAVRAAVDGGPPSPRKHTYSATEALYHDSQSQLEPLYSNHGHIRGSSDMHQSASGVVQSTSDVDSDINHKVAYMSLIKALSVEQEAHMNTKALLVQAECELKRLSSANSSLTATVKMLKGIEKHRNKKEQRASVSIPSQAEVDAEVARFHIEIKNYEREQKTMVEITPMEGHKVPAQEFTVDKSWNLDLTPEDFAVFEPKTEPKTPERTLHKGKLIDISPEHAHIRDNMVRAAPPTTQPAKYNTPLLEENATPVLELPASFLAKYQRKSKSSEQEIHELHANDSSESINLNETALKPRPTNTIKSNETPQLMAMPYRPEPGWTITALNPVFYTEHDKVSRIGYGGKLGDEKSVFWNHPVRYIPNKADKNIYRTVMIDFIPNGTTYKELLRCVRGSALESIQLFASIGSSNDFMTARVVFHYELDARTLYMYGQNPGINFKGKRLRIWQVLEPTYPKNKELEHSVFNQGRTRVLLMDNGPKDSLSLLSKKMEPQVKAGFVIEVSITCDEFIAIEFTSVVECEKALNLLLGDPAFIGAQFDFDQDPCAEPYQPTFQCHNS